MKKLVSMFAAIVAAFSFNSCDNESIIDQPEQFSDITVNISVASLEPDTKAIKTNWASGDKINIWFDNNSIIGTPKLVLTYDGTNWSASSMTEATISALKASGGNLKAIYESTNSLFAGSGSNSVRPLTSSAFGDKTVYYTPMSCYCQNVSYTFSSNTLTAVIDSWSYFTECQVVIAGLDPLEASNYALEVRDVTTDKFWLPGRNYFHISFGFGLNADTDVDSFSGGMSNGDGVVFRYSNMAAQFNGKTGDLLFTLIHKNGSTIDKTWTFTKNNTKADWDTDRCYGIKINKYKFMNTDANLLQGLFSVSATKTVQFTKGNLQATYDGTSYTWALAAHQYDFIGNAAGNTTIDAQTNGAVVDLFGLSTDAANNNWGIHTKKDATDGYTTGNFNDWGNLPAFSGKNYFTLSEDEWRYLLNRDNKTSGARTQTNRYAMAMVNGVKGLLIFPDNYNGTTAVSGTGIGSVNATNFPDSSIPTDTWTKMESAGVVFLPRAEQRLGSEVLTDDINKETGNYWTSSKASYTAYPQYLEFRGPSTIRPNGSISINSDSFFSSYSVRLVSAN